MIRIYERKTYLRRLLAATMILALIMLSCSCSPQKQGEEKKTEEQKYTGIISAMDKEVELLLEQAEIDRVDNFGGDDFHVGTLEGKPVVIVRSGIGKVLSAEATTAMINQYDISSVVFTGVAGGVGDETRVLDEVVGTRFVQADYGTVTDEGFKWTTGNTGEMVGRDGYFYSDEGLVDLAYKAAVDVVGEDHVFKGTIASGDQFIASDGYIKELREKFDALACEMEGAAVASVCTEYGVPFVVVRAMSDKADGKAHESFDNMMDNAADNSSRIVMAMLKGL